MGRVPTAVLAALLIASSTHRAAGQAPSTAALSEPSAPLQVILGTTTVEVPMSTLRSGDSRPAVDVMLNGRGPYRFEIETGGRLVAVSRRLASELALPKIAGPETMPEYHVDSVTIASASFRSLVVTVLPEHDSASDGLLGLPFFQSLLLTIDYPRRRVRLSRDSLPRPNGRDVLALTRQGDFWLMPIVIAGRPFDGIIDTQSSAGLSVTPSLGDSLTFAGGVHAIGRAVGAFGTTVLEAGTLAGNLEIGRYRFRRPVVTLVKLPPQWPTAPNIGTQVLANFVFSLDQERARVRLERGRFDPSR
jgi:hypothetical protein